MVKALVALLLTVFLCPNQPAISQTIISESGRLVFFNSLDSAGGATIVRLAGMLNCWLGNLSPGDSFPILLDLRPPQYDSANNLSRDTLQLGFDNLFGNSMRLTDSSNLPSDPGEQLYYRRLGLRIRYTSANPDPQKLLQLLDYGMTHNVYLKQLRMNSISDPSCPPGTPSTLVPADIATILAHPLPSGLHATLRDCSTP
jgi:hypothetical protein